MRGFRHFVALATTILVLTGCAAAGAGEGLSSGPRTGSSDRMMIIVANYNFSEVTVYADDGSGRIRLGRVGSMRTERFPAPRAFANNGQSLQIVGRPIGAEAEYITSWIPMHPRQYVQLNVMNNLAISNWSIWPR